MPDGRRKGAGSSRLGLGLWGRARGCGYGGFGEEEDQEEEERSLEDRVMAVVGVERSLRNLVMVEEVEEGMLELLASLAKHWHEREQVP